MLARSGRTLPLELSAVRLLSNCGCRLMALGAGFLDCCQPGRMGRQAASSGLASGDHLGSEVGSLHWSLVGDPAPSSCPGEQTPLLPGFPSGCGGLKGQMDTSWLALAAHGAPCAFSRPGLPVPCVLSEAMGPKPSAARQADEPKQHRCSTGLRAFCGCYPGTLPLSTASPSPSAADSGPLPLQPSLLHLAFFEL